MNAIPDEESLNGDDRSDLIWQQGPLGLATEDEKYDAQGLLERFRGSPHHWQVAR